MWLPFKGVRARKMLQLNTGKGNLAQASNLAKMREVPSAAVSHEAPLALRQTVHDLVLPACRLAKSDISSSLGWLTLLFVFLAEFNKMSPLTCCR